MLLYPRHTLPTATAPVLVASGLALHDGVARVLPAALAFLAGWSGQLGGVITDNYNNLRRHGDDPSTRRSWRPCEPASSPSAS